MSCLPAPACDVTGVRAAMSDPGTVVRDVREVMLRALLLRLGGTAEFDPDELYEAEGAVCYDLIDGVVIAEAVAPLDENCALDDQDGEDEDEDE